jgi:crotonobetainyl-CoA:carnitine CoA-transferase CaiB-like acyl-CoA transferase
LVECFFLVHDSHEMYHEGQARGLPIGVMNAPEDLFSDEHLLARGFFVPVEMSEKVGSVQYPGEPHRFSAFGGVPRTRAPKLGEHTAAVLAAAAP